MRRRAEIVERSFAHNLDRGGMRRTWLRGRENVHQRYLVHVASHNLGILMRLLIGAGTPLGVPALSRRMYSSSCDRVVGRPRDGSQFTRAGAAPLGWR